MKATTQVRVSFDTSQLEDLLSRLERTMEALAMLKADPPENVRFIEVPWPIELTCETTEDP